MFVYTERVHCRVHGPSCTWQVNLPGRVHVPRRHATTVCGPLRPCTRPVHSPFTAVLHGRPTRAYVYTAVKRPCMRHVHVRVHGQYTVVYMAGRPTRPCTLGPWTVYTAITRHVHGRVHVSYTAMYMFVYTGRVHGRVHGPYDVTGRTRP